MVKSKFGFFAYLRFLFTAFFFSIAFFIDNPKNFENSRWSPEVAASLLGIIVFAGTATLVVVNFKFANLVKIEKDLVSLKGLFTNKKIYSHDIQSIDLFTRKDLFWLAGVTTVVVSIQLHNGKTIFIVDPYYRNMDEIKRCLVENFEDKIILSKKKDQPPVQSNLESEYEKFAGNPHTSVNGIMMYAIVISFILILILEKKHLPVLSLSIAIGLIILFFFGLGYQLHYFLISNQHLVVKNHFLPWINRSYNIEDIIEANSESYSSRSDGLRITTRDFKSKIYLAGSLEEKHWKQLEEKLQSFDIYYLNLKT